MSVEWSFVDFGQGQFRLSRLSDERPDDTYWGALLTIAAEQPEGAMLASLAPHLMSAEDVLYHETLVRQQRLGDPTQ